MWSSFVVVLSLVSCSWLNDVPEDRVVRRAPVAPAARQPVEEDDTDREDVWDPVSRPIVPANARPVEFKSASGDPITGRSRHKDVPDEIPDVDGKGYTAE